MYIKKDTAEVLFKLIISCAYMKESVPGGFEKLKVMDKIVDFSIFESILEEVTYRKIEKFAQDSGKEIIDNDLLAEFFGGEPHFQKIIGQLSVERVSEDFFHKTVFAHMEVVAEITQTDGTIEAIYKNGELFVKIKNLVLFPGDVVLVGDKVLVHYAVILSKEISIETEKKIMKEQSARAEFVEACRYLANLGGIDYAEFLDLCEGTRAMIQNCV